MLDGLKRPSAGIATLAGHGRGRRPLFLICSAECDGLCKDRSRYTNARGQGLIPTHANVEIKKWRS